MARTTAGITKDGATPMPTPSVAPELVGAAPEAAAPQAEPAEAPEEEPLPVVNLEDGQKVQKMCVLDCCHFGSDFGCQRSSFIMMTDFCVVVLLYNISRVVAPSLSCQKFSVLEELVLSPIDRWAKASVKIYSNKLCNNFGYGIR